MKIVLVHGWGGDARYWEALREEFDGSEVEAVELGFTGVSIRTDPPFEKAFYITHSLGTLWALKNHAAHMSGLVAINGFTCFHAFTDQRVLKAMQRGLQKDTKRQMQNFYASADMTYNGELHAGRLEKGLHWLSTWDTRPVFDALDVPFAALAGARDKIVPLKELEAQFGGAVVREDGGHNLPQTHTEWCAEFIKACMKTV